MAKAKLLAKQADDLAVGDACFGRFDDPLVNVLARAIGGARQRIESMAHVSLAALRLVGLKARHVLLHAFGVRALGRPAAAVGFVDLIAIDADHLLVAGFHPLLEGQRGFADHRSG